jgi:NHLM bacteriocin system ABC transporter peptidase/ATP-binding protein
MMSFFKSSHRPLKTPTVIQMEMTECGAASLSMILQYYGKYVPLTQLRIACGVSRDGSDAAGIIRAAKSLGMEAKGFTRGLEKLKKSLLPIIIFWEFNHFLVLEGFSGGRVFLNDPALGPRSVTDEEFDISYTGIALDVRPGPEFVQSGKAPSVWPLVLQRMATEKTAVLFCLVAGLLLIIPKLTIPIYSQIYIDEIVGSNMQNWLKPMLWAFFLSIAFMSVANYIQLIGQRLLSRRLDRRFSVDFEHHVLSLPEQFYSQRYAGDINNRSELNKKVAEFIAEKLIPTITQLVQLVFYMIITYLYSWHLGLVITGTSMLNALIISQSLDYQKDANLQLQKDSGKAQAVVVGAFMDIETVKSAAVESDVYKRFTGYTAKAQNFGQLIQRKLAKMELLPEFLTTFNEVSILMIGFILVLNGKLTLGMLLAAQVIALKFAEEINSILSFVRALPEFQGHVIRLEDVIEQPIDPILASSTALRVEDFPADRKRLTGMISIDNISFGYIPTKPPLINNISIEIKPGQRIAFVGGSGSGKSTISKIIAGLYMPNQGSIKFDGFTLSEIPRSIAISSIAMVQQEINLYGCSVRDNLTLWNKEIPQSQIEEACMDACIHDVINALPEGYETILREGGRSLSGGQRQRLEIARALVQNPSILILDEATSALDPETEKLVDEGFRRRGCTLIIVAHRLSTIRDADEIIVVDKGSIVQRGRHIDMCRIQGSPYQKLLSEGVSDEQEIEQEASS